MGTRCNDERCVSFRLSLACKIRVAGASGVCAAKGVANFLFWGLPRTGLMVSEYIDHCKGSATIPRGERAHLPLPPPFPIVNMGFQSLLPLVPDLPLLPT